MFKRLSIICLVAGYFVTSIQEGYSTATGTKIIRLAPSSEKLDPIIIEEDGKIKHKSPFKDFTSLDFANCERIKAIGAQTFCGCNDLTQVTLPNSITKIEEKAFMGCTKLREITIPSSVQIIGNSAFSNCLSLTQVIIPNSIKEIGDSTFFNCMKLTQVSIPSSVRKIGEKAFSVCASLEHIELPASVTELGRQAFSLCRKLTQMTIHGRINQIGDEAFEFCNSLREVQWTGEHPSQEIIARFPQQTTHVYLQFGADHKVLYKEILKDGGDFLTEFEGTNS